MIDVTCAVIRNEDDGILVVQRGEATDHPFKWEFPGGKLHPGEQEEECIIREVKEELSMDIVVFRRLADVVHDYGHKQVRLIPFVCDTLDDVPFLSEHVAYRWTSVDDLAGIDFSEADVFVAEDYIRTFNPGRKDQAAAPVPAGVEEDDGEIREMVNRIMGTKEAEWAARSAVENPALLKKFLGFSYSDDQKLAFHSSWILTKACDMSPGLLDPFMEGIIESLPSIGNESTLRSFLRIISLSDPGKYSAKQQGLLADICFGHLNSAFSAIAIKAYSMEILYRLTLIYPGLATELAASIRNLLETGSSAGICSRARAILKRMDK